jgi:hypothetical protein
VWIVSTKNTVCNFYDTKENRYLRAAVFSFENARLKKRSFWHSFTK